jgi:hypothetical protein
MIRGMGHDDDRDSSWGRQLLFGVGALAAGTLLIGGVVGLVAIGAVNVLGLDGSSGHPTAEPTLYIPSGEPTTQPGTYPNPTAPSSSAPTPSASSPTASPTRKKPRKQITLQAFPAKVAAGQRIDLTGVYQGAEGAGLQVQRFEGGWTDFPVTMSVSGGMFHTWVTTSHTGENRFRVLDKASGRASNPVRVTVG